MAKNNLLDEHLKYTGENKTPTRINLCSYDKDLITDRADITPAILAETAKGKYINWIQVTGFKDTEIIEEIFKQFDIDFLTRQDILNPDHLPKIEEHGDYNVIILKFLKKNESADYEPLHICIIQGKTYIITFLEREYPIFDGINKALYNNTLKIRQKQSDYLLGVIINEIISGYMSVVSEMEDDLENLEEKLIMTDNINLFDKPKSMEFIPIGEARKGLSKTKVFGMEEIQQYRKNYRLIKKSVFPLKEHLGKLFHVDNELINESQLPYFNDVNDHLMFVLQTMESCRDLITSITDLYMSKNDRRLNDIMKQLTIVSTIFIPLTFLAGIWGMNFENMPELTWKYGYIMAWGVIIAIGIILFLFFRHKKW